MILPDENDPYVEMTNIIREIQDRYEGDYDLIGVFELMTLAFFAGVDFERRSVE